MQPLETYLRELREIRDTGAAQREVSFYPALSNLFNELGKSLAPRVRCVMPMADQGAGMPDGGLFTADQFAKKSAPAPLAGQPPSRGAIEVKGTREQVADISDSEQVSRYWGRYRQVLVTNYRDFLLVGQDREGNPVKLEAYHLAENERAFWEATGHPQRAVTEHGERFLEYLKRVMLHAAPLAAPADLAWFLASYARDAKARVEAAAQLPALESVRQALEEALGVKFEGEKGERFFRSSLIQTLFYGVFSAWVLWSKTHPPASTATFDWHAAQWSLKVPMIRALFEQVATPTRLQPLGLVEVLDWTAAALNRVDRASFFARFEEGHAVQYFYEPFLEAFDPELRKELGVWYTPPEIVQYMVARVDTVLREELEIADGLADDRVYVLDPCCGTGAYLVEVLRKIGQTLAARGEDALAAQDLKAAATTRVFGFEILPAPFVVAHLQLGLVLQNAGAPLSDARNERVGVYLTNALTGWKPPEGPKQHLAFPEMEEERDRADEVKQQRPILVILGNPPYNGFAGMAVDEERELSDAYRTTRRAPAPQGQGLNDLYVRFYRMAERRIVEGSPGRGVVCFISNYSWLDGLSFTGMRERYLEAFDKIWIDCLNGDKYKTGKLTPEGESDPSVFSTDFNREGIQVGTAIGLLVRKESHFHAEHVAFRHFWGKDKLAELDELAAGTTSNGYETVQPAVEIGLSLLPSNTATHYFDWPLLPELFPEFFPGVQTKRDELVVDIDRRALVERMERYFDPSVSNAEMAEICPRAMKSTARFPAEESRSYLINRGFLPQNIVRYAYRPFDVRWVYWEPETRLLGEKVAAYFPHVFSGNVWIASQQKPRREWSRPQFIGALGNLDLMDRGASCIPLVIRPKEEDGTFLRTHSRNDARYLDENRWLNISDGLFAYRAILSDVTDDAVFFHCMAILHSDAYSQENEGGLRQNWPRIPLARPPAQLQSSAQLGRTVAAMLDVENSVPRITKGNVRTELKPIGLITCAGPGRLNPDAGDLDVTARWGFHSGTTTMPAKGRWEQREYLPAEREAIEAGAREQGLTAEQALACLGQTTCDVYLNDRAFWKNVPIRVWEYTLGGYQVIKKWLSYREKELLGRGLSMDEARYVTEMARRIAALLLLGPALDANYEAVKAATYAWPRAGQGGQI